MRLPPVMAGVFHPDFSGFGDASFVAWAIGRYGCECNVVTKELDWSSRVAFYQARHYPNRGREPL